MLLLIVNNTNYSYCIDNDQKVKVLCMKLIIYH